MKGGPVVGLLILAAIATILGTAELTTRFFLARENILRIEEVQMDFEVDDYVGINTDADALHFGTVPPGNTGQRFVSLKNDNTFPVVITIAFKGEAGKYAWTEPELVLDGGEARNITVSVAVPEDMAYGSYIGTVYFTFREAGQ